MGWESFAGSWLSLIVAVAPCIDLAQAYKIGRALFQKRSDAFAGFFGGLRLHHQLRFKLQLVSQRLRR